MQEWMESCSYGTDTGKLVVDFVDGNQYDSIAASTESHLQLFLYQATIPDSSTSITAYIAWDDLRIADGRPAKYMINIK